MKKFLLGNLGTKAMAFFLAMLTWIYLFRQSNGVEELEVLFSPRLDPQQFASAIFRDAAGRDLVPGSTLRVQIGGATGDVRSLALRPPRLFSCTFAVDPKDLAEPHGVLKLVLERSYFDLPETVTVTPLPGPQVTLQYAKYSEKVVQLVADRASCDGLPAPGYQVESVLTIPDRILAKVPADRLDIEKVAIQKVPVEGRVMSFTLERWDVEPAVGALQVKPLAPFRVDVKIVAVPVSRRVTLDLHVLAKPEFLRRIELETRTIVVELRGPEGLVAEAEGRVREFLAYVVVTDRDMETPGSRNISDIGCHILEPKYRNAMTVIPMPDEKPENRQVKIKVLP